MWGFVQHNVLYHSLSGLASGHLGRLPQTATIRSLVCSREMHPLAFLDPSAFIVTNEANETLSRMVRKGRSRGGTSFRSGGMQSFCPKISLS
jgi:hypothetical protein